MDTDGDDKTNGNIADGPPDYTSSPSYNYPETGNHDSAYSSMNEAIY